MSVEGVLKLVDELAGGSPPFRMFGERLKEELEEVVMTDTPEEEVPAEAEEPPDEPPTEYAEDSANQSDPEDERTGAEVEASTEPVN